MKTVTEYNGWKNKATWNVALWIGNDEHLYNAAKEYATNNPTKKKLYASFIIDQGLAGDFTPDRVKWNGKDLDYTALSAMMRELQ